MRPFLSDDPAPEKSSRQNIGIVDRVRAIKGELPEWFTVDHVVQAAGIEKLQAQSALSNLHTYGQIERSSDPTRGRRGRPQQYRWKR